jgi:hypothetical protein
VAPVTGRPVAPASVQAGGPAAAATGSGGGLAEILKSLQLLLANLGKQVGLNFG